MKAVNGGVVGFFSCEMSAEQLATRISPSRPASPRARSAAAASPRPISRRSATIRSSCSRCRFYVDETGGLSISQLTARARRLKRQKGLDLIVIDYIQLLQGSGKRGNDNRVQEVTEITTSLKALAKELNVPVIALSQLSRQVENRDDKRPQLSDLRESGSIEQDADVVMFVYREEYYLAEQGAARRHAGTREMAARHGRWRTARPKSSSASSATARPARSNCNSKASVTRFGDLAQDGQLPDRGAIDAALRG